MAGPAAWHTPRPLSADTQREHTTGWTFWLGESWQQILGVMKGGWNNLPAGHGHRPQCTAKGSQRALWDTEPREVLLPPSCSQTSRRHESAHLSERDGSASRFSVFKTRLIILYSSGSQRLIEFSNSQNNENCLPTTARLQLLCKVK